MSKARSAKKSRVATDTSLPPIRKIGISTGGGDAPGLNAVIRAVVLAAHNHGWECCGIRDGYSGLLSPARYPQGGMIPLTSQSVRGITHLGGTLLGTTNVGHPLRYPTQLRSGKIVERDRSDELVQALAEAGIDAVVAIGGDGSLGIAKTLAEKGVRVVGVPKTIDNDLDGTVVTFGFDTAVSFATECLDRLHTTAASHHRIMVVEVMGRYAGWIALAAGVAGSADAVLIPEIPFDLAPVVEKVQKRDRAGAGFSIIVVAEGAMPKGGKASVIEKRVGAMDRLGGAGERVAKLLQAATGKETRHVVLGHLLRGGTPTAADRQISLRFGAAAVRALAAGKSGVMVALDPPTVRYVPLATATRRMKMVPLDCDTVLTARELGVCLGD
ncbi:MAG: ATP-dependent 6-phosphofructokinase [Planctomycetes bacterium]|nr:ATP-dependent 6-phosphofructokinase [Planctomycetota bacterium]